MPSSHRFLIKDSPPEVLEKEGSDVKVQGRTFSYDVMLGVTLACLAITDDKPGTLERVAKLNPWQLESLKIITGSEEAAHQPLSELLASMFNLTCDECIDVSGFTRAGHVLDTQGFIAHNDQMIVLAYRCTTSGFDWITNMTTTSSAWEAEDLEKGHSGYFSCLTGECGFGSYKPRVHTGFYNNFISTVPAIRKHIDPLLQPDQPPRKLYVVGHSLGAGIATMATCYFLTEFDWAALPHKLVSVTAGSPRACRKTMQELIDAKMAELRPLDKVVIARVVHNKDSVASVPPEIFGFRHLGKLVYITKDERVLIDPPVGSKDIVGKRTYQKLEENPDLATDMEGSDDNDDDDEQGDTSEEKKDISPADKQDDPTNYDKRIKLVPRALRDHMPEFYLRPLMHICEKDERQLRKEQESISPTQHSTRSTADEKTSRRRMKRWSWRLLRRNMKGVESPSPVAAPMWI